MANTEKSAICNDRKVASGTNLAVKIQLQNSVSTVLQQGTDSRPWISYVSHTNHPQAYPTVLYTESDLMAVE
jgi:hypothetical protein